MGSVHHVLYSVVHLDLSYLAVLLAFHLVLHVLASYLSVGPL
jgi:hypothetical protein